MKLIHIVILIMIIVLIVIVSVEYQFNRQVDLLSLVSANTMLIEQNQKRGIENRELIGRLVEVEMNRYSRGGGE